MRSYYIKKIFSSDILRAKETAFGIGTGMNREVEIIDGIYERYGSESHEIFLERIKNVRRLFESLPEGHYVVVSHAIFIKNIIQQLLLDDLFTEDISIKATNKIIIDNASITTCIYNQNKKAWRLESGNK